ncbi:hypothetical protein FBY31_4628 [Arthrobacter sp. SLBN-100]|nr:hypothetical protein FBY31_4628 [Arthrobacter sp. SLBN-100]
MKHGIFALSVPFVVCLSRWAGRAVAALRECPGRASRPCWKLPTRPVWRGVISPTARTARLKLLHGEYADSCAAAGEPMMVMTGSAGGGAAPDVSERARIRPAWKTRSPTWLPGSLPGFANVNSPRCRSSGPPTSSGWRRIIWSRSRSVPGSRASVVAAQEQLLLTGFAGGGLRDQQVAYGRRVGRNGHLVWERNY